MAVLATTKPSLGEPSGMVNGLTFLTRGANLITHKELRLFVLVPLLINIVLFFVLTGILIQQFDSAVGWLLGWLPSWLDFISWFIWSLFAATVLVIYGYSFSIITNIIAAPFYGLLAERAEGLITGKRPDSEPLSEMIPRTLGREMLKLWYFISRGAAIFIISIVLSFIPIVNILVPVIAILWGAWSMSIQYVDYPADNHQLAFTELRKRLGGNLTHSYTFGGLVMLGTMVPILNIFIMPVAVVGGTYYWVEKLTLVKAEK
ncbi:sulfate transporter CysZ [Maricurvus nonylphenolicus]